MNERIRELAQQAEVKWQHQEDVIYSTMTLEQLEKFAELIVRECMDLSMLPESACDNWNYLHLSPAEAIAKHFGVEE